MRAQRMYGIDPRLNSVIKRLCSLGLFMTLEGADSCGLILLEKETIRDITDKSFVHVHKY